MHWLEVGCPKLFRCNYTVRFEICLQFCVFKEVMSMLESHNFPLTELIAQKCVLIMEDDIYVVVFVASCANVCASSVDAAVVMGGGGNKGSR